MRKITEQQILLSQAMKKIRLLIIKWEYELKLALAKKKKKKLKIGINQFKLKDAYHQRQQNVDRIIKPACFHRLASQFRRNLS
jgi:hypothetical protein